jgi:hypothetical protein
MILVAPPGHGENGARSKDHLVAKRSPVSFVKSPGMKSKYIVISALALFGVLGWGLLVKQPPPAAVAPVPASNSDGVEPALPAPHNTPAASTPAFSPAEPPPPATNPLARYIKGDVPSLTLEQLQTFLQANHRSAESLLTAYQATHNRELLDEAIAKYPNDPRVAFNAWFHPEPSADDPEGLKARRQALDNFKQVAPDNALANYLSAANYFKTGQPGLAVQDMQAGATKGRYDDYVQDAIQSMQEAYQTAGYPEVEAKLAATTGALLPHLAELKAAGMGLLDLAGSYKQSGDSASAQSAVQMCLDLGQRLDDGDSLTLIQLLVGLAIQRKAYDAMAASALDPAAAQAIQASIDSLTKRREDIKNSVSSLNLESWLQTAPAEDVKSYLDRERLFGEQRALQWLANRQQQ